MQARWKDASAGYLIALLSRLPQSIYDNLTRSGAKLLDKHKGHIARASLQLAMPETLSPEAGTIARQSAHHSLSYLLSLPRLNAISYQLHDQAIIEAAMAENRGMIVISLHTGPPDLGTLALTRKGVPAKTVIGAGKHSPWLNSLGRYALNKAGVRFILRGDATGVLQAVKKRQAVFLYSDMRSKEMEVTFFGQQTFAPASGIYTALLTRCPILFHYCTLENNQWQLHFERFEIEHKNDRKNSVQHNLQRLIHRMEDVIRKHPQLWIWHYDRFKLKNLLAK